MTRRLFFAFEFPENIRDQLAQAGRELASLAQRGRWTSRDNIHLTLQFLGDCPDDWLPDLHRIPRKAAAACPPIELEFAGAGSFGRAGEILRLGVKPQHRLSELVSRLTGLLQMAGLPFESRPYFPHITIGRQVMLDANRLSAWTMAPLCCRIDTLSLMESTRISERLVYRPILRERLQGLV